MKNQVQEFPASTRIAWTNSVGRAGSGSAGAISSGSVLRLGVLGLFAVAGVALAANATGVVETRGTFKLPKATGVTYSVGQRVGYDFTNDRVTTDLTAGACGTVRTAAATGDTTVEVELNESGERVFSKVLTPTAGEATANSMDVDVGFPVAGAVAHCQIINGSNAPRLPSTVVFNPGSAAPTTVRITETDITVNDRVHLTVREAASA